MIKPALFKWGPISKKQLQVLTWWRKDSPVKDKDVIICDGSIRSGKSVSMSFSFVEWAMSTFSGKLFALCGKTVGSLRQNVIVDLVKILRARGYAANERRAEKLIYVKRGTTENVFEIFGGKDESSQDLIQGRTLAGVLFDEATLMPKSFVDQAMGRCSIDGSKIWFNCNPEGPYHWFKIDILDNAESINAFHLHFTMDDNLTLSEQIKNRYKSLYTGVFYKRFILGLWVVAEGIIYDIWDDKYIIDCPDSYPNYIIGIDYGTSNPCTFGLYGFKDYTRFWLKSEYYYDSAREGRQKTDGQYADDFDRWVSDNHVPREKIRGIYVDPSALSFITELKRRGWMIKDANNEVLDGIRCIAGFIGSDNFLVDISCIETQKEFSSYAWDPRAQRIGEDKPLKTNDHCMDRNRYAIFSHVGLRKRSFAEVLMQKGIM